MSPYWLKVHLVHSLHRKENLITILNGKKLVKIDIAPLPDGLHRGVVNDRGWNPS